MQTQTTAVASARTAAHKIQLPNTEWALWRWACLRGAGFPAHSILKLAAPPPMIAAAEKLLETENAAVSAEEKVLQEINASLDRLRAKGEWSDKSQRGRYLKAIHRVKEGKSVDLLSLEIQADLVGRLSSARQQAIEMRLAFTREYDKAVEQTSEAIREVAAEPRFREAVTWQNRQAVHTALNELTQKKPGDGRRSGTRQHEELVANYLQRYCVKNDTIGFFGPVGWADLTESGEALTVAPGRDLVAARKVYFETWAIDAFANSILKYESVYRSLAPIVMPFVRIDGQTLHHPVYGQTKITLQQAAVMKACNGLTAAKNLARTLARCTPWFSNELQVYEVLKLLAKKGLVFWGLYIPQDSAPEEILRKAILAIDDLQLRQKALDGLNELEAARSAVAASAGNADALDLMLSQLEKTFTRLTAMTATRGHGQTYAGRMLIYEDCRRDVKVSIGPEVLLALAAPMSLLLTSARWVTFEFAKIYREKFTAVYSQLARETGSPSVDAAGLFLKIAPIVNGDRAEQRHPIQAGLQEKWQHILGLESVDPKARSLEFSSEHLHKRVMAEFSCPGPGWSWARYHSPDVMIMASSPEAVQRGDYRLVMGEMHVGGNTMSIALFANQHPAPQELLRAVESDLQGPQRAVPVISKDSQGGARLCPALVPPVFFRLEYERSFAKDRSRALAISSLVIEDCQGEFVALTRDGKLKFDAMELLSLHFNVIAASTFHMIGARSHTPRISIDRLIVQRECWQFLPSELIFAWERDPATRYLKARKWAKTHGIPRFAFFKVPVERKPCYLDLDSPVYVDIFARLIRRTAEAGIEQPVISLSEMLPGPDQLWLSDLAGNRYTSELRIAAVDLIVERHTQQQGECL